MKIHRRERTVYFGSLRIDDIAAKLERMLKNYETWRKRASKPVQTSMTNLLSPMVGRGRQRTRTEFPKLHSVSCRSGTLPHGNQLYYSVLETLLSAKVPQRERIEQPTPNDLAYVCSNRRLQTQTLLDSRISKSIDSRQEECTILLKNYFLIFGKMQNYVPTSSEFFNSSLEQL